MKFKCPICKHKFACKRNLLTHLNSNKAFCEAKITQEDVQDGVHILLNMRGNEAQVALHKIFFKKFRACDRRIKRKIPTKLERLNICFFCSEEFSREDSLRRHMKSVHSLKDEVIDRLLTMIHKIASRPFCVDDSDGKSDEKKIASELKSDVLEGIEEKFTKKASDVLEEHLQLMGIDEISPKEGMSLDLEKTSSPSPKPRLPEGGDEIQAKAYLDELIFLKKSQEEQGLLLKQLMDTTKTLEMEKEILKAKVKGQNIERQMITNNNNTLQLLDFGKEDMSHITEGVAKQILSRGVNSVPCLIHKLHFDKDMPQNHNFLNSSLEGDYVKVCIKGEWKARLKRDIIEDLFHRGFEQVEDLHDHYYPELRSSTKGKMKKALSEQSDPKARAIIEKRINLVGFNGRKVVTETQKNLGPSKD